MARAAFSYRDLKSSLEAQGFPLVGWVDLSLSREAFSAHQKSFLDWTSKGRHGSMAYLENRSAERLDPTQWYPEAHSVVAVALPYDARPRGNGRERWARYLQGRDYHLTMRENLERGLANLRSLDPDLQWKVAVDSSPVLERAWAWLSGLGWIGKNGLLIHPKLGSYLFLGCAFLNVDSGLSPQPLPDYCGHCERCLRACPTEAFAGPRVLDARKCISYWTLEYRGEDLPLPDQKKVGPWIAGCDVCQEVCPFNRSKSDAALTLDTDFAALADLSSADYKLQTQDSAFSRVKQVMLKRNLSWTRASKTEEQKPPPERA